MPSIIPAREDAYAFVKSGVPQVVEYGTIPDDAWMIVLLPPNSEPPVHIDVKCADGHHYKYLFDQGLTDRVRMRLQPRESFSKD